MRAMRRQLRFEQRLRQFLPLRAQAWPGRRRRHWETRLGVSALAWGRVSRRPCMRSACQVFMSTGLALPLKCSPLMRTARDRCCLRAGGLTVWNR